MDETEPPESGSENTTNNWWVNRSRFEYVWLDGVRISPFDCPGCLDNSPLPCADCPFFAPSLCKLRRDPFLREDLKALFAHYRDRAFARLKYQSAVVSALFQELATHGRPLHYTVLARIASDRHPHLHLSESITIQVLSDYPDKFEKLGEGVYRHL